MSNIFDNIDLGEVKSRNLGNVTKALVNLGKETVTNMAPNIDYGDLPSRALPQIGKLTAAYYLEENGAQQGQNKLHYS